MEEIFKPIPNYENIYSISNLGRIRKETKFCKLDSSHIMKTFYPWNGYEMVKLMNNGRRKLYSVHILVLSTFKGEPPTSKHECHHINNNRKDNRIENLEWITKKENHWHKFHTHGFSQKGEKNHCAKLTDNQAIQIREIYKSGNILMGNLAKQFNVSRTTIWDIVHLKRFSHI